jgi:hypothetical protein
VIVKNPTQEIIAEVKRGSMQSISSIGFTPLEQQLLAKQVKIVSTRIHAGWQYLGETIKADLVLAKTKLPVEAKSLLILVGDFATEDGYKTLESPIRLMQLAELLNANSENTFSNAQAIADLLKAKMNQPFVVECLEFPVYFLPGRRSIGATNCTVSKLYKNLAKTHHSRFDPQYSRNLETNHSLDCEQGIKTVIWQVAKLESSFARSRIADGIHYKVSVWPRVKDWDPNPIQNKLATVFARQYITPVAASNLCNVDLDTVKVFLHCCESVGIPVVQKDTGQGCMAAYQEPINDAQTLGWLQKKLKTFLKHGS